VAERGKREDRRRQRQLAGGELGGQPDPAHRPQHPVGEVGETPGGQRREDHRHHLEQHRLAVDELGQHPGTGERGDRNHERQPDQAATESLRARQPRLDQVGVVRLNERPARCVGGVQHLPAEAIEPELVTAQ
jgi:hypothetical protein